LVLDAEESVWELGAEPAVNFQDAYRGECGREGEAIFVDPLLDGDMSFGFDLEISLSGIEAVVIGQGAFDVDGVGVVALDEIGVVAVHGPHEGGERGHEGGGEAVPESGRLLGEIEGEVLQGRSMARGLREEEGLHSREGFAAIGDIRVLFHGLF
jgi:hypothetical protein